ncbi:unnamed protein product [Ceratitis capitata]|uniref:(Mediterranean fruit fly) hypothetical protein n=1 Tax=Ceratitis capitata TaxID=7213 RepID=A0A811V3B7_CERCA|nr:unnamed protein product [Ceratitis capitata]
MLYTAALSKPIKQSKMPCNSKCQLINFFKIQIFFYLNYKQQILSKKKLNKNVLISFTDQFECEIMPPASISEIPEKLLTTSGIYLPGTSDLKGHPIVTVDAECVLAAGLNCYEIATVLLYYSTLPERRCCKRCFGHTLWLLRRTVVQILTHMRIPKCYSVIEAYLHASSKRCVYVLSATAGPTLVLQYTQNIGTVSSNRVTEL